MFSSKTSTTFQNAGNQAILVGSTPHFTALSAHSGAAKPRRRFEASCPDCTVSCSVDGIIRDIDGHLESLRNKWSIWEYYNEIAAVHNKTWEIEWRDLAYTVLIFVRLGTLDNIWVLIWFQGGLFAASLSALFAFLIRQPQPSSADVAMDVCVHSSQQLSNSTVHAFVSHLLKSPPTQPW